MSACSDHTDTFAAMAAAMNADTVKQMQGEIARLRGLLDRSRTALLHGTPEQRFNMASIITTEALAK